MKCTDARPLIHELLDGELADRTAGELNAHCAKCEQCAALLAELEGLQSTMTALEAELPADTEQRIAATVREELAPRPGGRLSWAFAGGLAAATLLLGLAMGREAFPREVVITEQVVKEVPRVERVVVTETVEVPVVQERFITETVVRYVSRPAPPAEPTATPAEEPVRVARAVEEARATPAVAEPSAPPAAPAGRALGDTMFVGYAPSSGVAGDQEAPLTSDQTTRLAAALALAVEAFEERSGVTDLAGGLEGGFDELGGRLDGVLSAAP
jgi:hypothetical protein